MKRGVRLVGLSALAAIAAGCAGQKNPLLLPNRAPEVEVFAERLDRSTSGPFTYRQRWVGHDPDGRIDHFLYSFGSPADQPGAWTMTSARDHTLSFSAPDSAGPTPCGDTEPRIFSVRAVDAAGRASGPARVAVFNGVIAPQVRIVAPPPNPLVRYHVGPTLCVKWVGTAPDVDGLPSSDRIVRYKFKLLTELTEVSLTTARQDPDSIRRYCAPRHWAGFR